MTGDDPTAVFTAVFDALRKVNYNTQELEAQFFKSDLQQVVRPWLPSGKNADADALKRAAKFFADSLAAIRKADAGADLAARIEGLIHQINLAMPPSDSDQPGSLGDLLGQYDDLDMMEAEDDEGGHHDLSVVRKWPPD